MPVRVSTAPHGASVRHVCEGLAELHRRSRGEETHLVNGNPRICLFCHRARPVGSRKHGMLVSAGGQETQNPVNHAKIVAAQRVRGRIGRRRVEFAVNLVDRSWTNHVAGKCDPWAQGRESVKGKRVASDAAKSSVGLVDAALITLIAGRQLITTGYLRKSLSRQWLWRRPYDDARVKSCASISFTSAASRWPRAARGSSRRASRALPG